MSSRGVLIRIIALLQRKTLIETKNRTLKCLKWQYSTVPSMKNVAVLTEDGALPLFSSPPRGIWQLKSPHSREFAIQGKQNANARGSAREGGGGIGSKWNWLMHNPALNNPAQGNRNRSVCCWFLGNRLHWKVKKKQWLYSICRRK